MNRFGQRKSQPLRRPAIRIAWLALAAVAVFACDSSGPVDDVFLFEGRLGYQEEVIHTFTTNDEGIARAQVAALRPVLLDTTFGLAIVIGLGIGEPNDVGECAATFRTNARLGSIFSVGLEKETVYCVLVFDNGSLPEDAQVDYTISISPG